MAEVSERKVIEYRPRRHWRKGKEDKTKEGEPLVAKLVFACQDDDGKEKTSKVKVWFESQFLFEMLEGDSFDTLLDPINEYLAKVKPGFHIEDFPEEDDTFHGTKLPAYDIKVSWERDAEGVCCVGKDDD